MCGSFAGFNDEAMQDQYFFQYSKGTSMCSTAAADALSAPGGVRRAIMWTDGGDLNAFVQLGTIGGLVGSGFNDAIDLSSNG